MLSPSLTERTSGPTSATLPHTQRLGAEMAVAGEKTMHDEPNAMTIEPDETEELAWQFTETGTVLIGCHQVGHYAAGMKATITVGS